MKSKISRRSFLRNIAAAGSGAAALGLLAGCSSSSTAASSGSTAAAEDKYTPGTYSASKTISYSEIGVSMTFDANSITACEITSSGEQDLLTDDKKTAMAKAIVEGQRAGSRAGRYPDQLHAGGLRGRHPGVRSRLYRTGYRH